VTAGAGGGEAVVGLLVRAEAGKGVPSPVVPAASRRSCADCGTRGLFGETAAVASRLGYESTDGASTVGGPAGGSGAPCWSEVASTGALRSSGAEGVLVVWCPVVADPLGVPLSLVVGRATVRERAMLLPRTWAKPLPALAALSLLAFTVDAEWAGT